MPLKRRKKKVSSRRRQFCDPEHWYDSKSKAGNIWRWVDLRGEKERVTVYQTGGLYGVYVHGYEHRGIYESQGEAKRAAYQFVRKLNDEDWD